MCERFMQYGKVVSPRVDAMVETRDGSLAKPFGYRAPWLRPAERPVMHVRAEVIMFRPAWREAARNRRCAVEVQGWTEKGVEHVVEDDLTLWLAGLWWRNGFALLTMPSCEELAAVHHRQPAFVARPELWTGAPERAMPVEPALRVLQAQPPRPIRMEREAAIAA